MMNNINKFYMRWSGFEKNIRDTFRELREENHFDVTLACDDGHQIHAHKTGHYRAQNGVSCPWSGFHLGRFSQLNM